METARQEGEFPEGHESGSHKVAEMKDEGRQQKRKVRPGDYGMAVPVQSSADPPCEEKRQTQKARSQR